MLSRPGILRRAGWIGVAATVGFVGWSLAGLDQASVDASPTPSPSVARSLAGSASSEQRVQMLPPPFGERGIVPPREGEPARSQTAAYCESENWKRMALWVGRSDAGAFRVDEAAWQRTLASSRSGIANWMSQCHEGGAPIEIVAATSGETLARYDMASGLQTLRD